MSEESQEVFYKDRGCILSPTCLSCPEPICAYEYPGGFRAYIKQKELKEALKRGCGIKEAAALVGMHYQTAERLYVRTIKLSFEAAK